LAIVGTANLDNRSFKLNFEVIAAIYGHEANATLAQWFLEDQAKSERLVVRKLKETRHERLLAGVARLFSPIL
jgi:cardiolipin synthase A/B